MHPYQGGVAPENMTLPVAEYPHLNRMLGHGGVRLPRGEALPELQGIYFFGDYCSGRTWTLYRDESESWQVAAVHANWGYVISSFGQDEAGELFLVEYKGGIYRLERADAP